MKIRFISVFAVILLVAAVLISCGLFGFTKEQRITAFIEDLNQNPRANSIRYNFSPSCTVYNTIDGTFFNIDFPTDSIAYSISSLNLDADPVTATIAGTGGSFGGPFTIEFTLVQDGFDWFILKLVLDGSTIVE